MPVDKSYIGMTGKPITMHIERGMIRQFAQAIKDDDPVYFDDDVARRENGGVMPPITFLQTVGHWDLTGEGRPRPPMDRKRVLHGEQEYEFFRPIYVGDTLTAVTKIADIFEKSGKRGGTMTFVVNETEFTNQRGELVAKARQVGIETGQVVKD